MGVDVGVHAISASAGGALHASPHNALVDIRVADPNGSHAVKSLFHLEVPDAGATHAVWRVRAASQLVSESTAQSIGGSGTAASVGGWLVSSTHLQLPALQTLGLCELAPNPTVTGAVACPASPNGTSAWSTGPSPLVGAGAPSASAPLCFRALRIEFMPNITVTGALHGELTWGAAKPATDAVGNRVRNARWTRETQSLLPARAPGSVSGQMDAYVLVYSVVGGPPQRNALYSLRILDDAGAEVPLTWLSAQLWDTRTDARQARRHRGAAVA